MIRHSLSEGWLLLRSRGLVSVTLALALAVPVGLSGLTIILSRWLEPMVAAAGGERTVAILLHPHMDAAQRERWISDQAERNPEWTVRAVPRDELEERLVQWFPYLTDLLEGDGGSLLPQLVEVSTEDTSQLEALRTSPAVIAVGPRSSLHKTLDRAAGRLGLALAGISLVLLAAAAVLAAIWVHLELFRHSDEITIMRLIGAEESAVRGPFILAVTAPGVLAAVLAISATLFLTSVLSRPLVTIGLPPLSAELWVLALEAVVACLIPVAAAFFTLRRHTMAELQKP
jgi:cell division protein FtsX